MIKAWDVKDLWTKVKAKGVEPLKATLKAANESLCDWTSESCAMSENKIVKFLAAAPQVVKPIVNDQIDKIA
jgi:hypothetical protein